MGKSAIEWTERTWNPVTGCTKVSQGCRRCYAERQAKRLRAMGAPGYAGGFAVTLHPERLRHPIDLKKPSLFFVCSMGDLFHAKVPDSYIDQVFRAIQDAHWHTFQVLTKRADRMHRFFRNRPVPHNAWLGVSVEDQAAAARAEILKCIIVSTRFLSCEPLLGPLELDLKGIDWVIAGGESGPGARPMRPERARAVRDQCQAAGVDFFFKQWGEHGEDGKRVGKRAAGRLLDGREHSAMPSYTLRQERELYDYPLDEDGR